MQNELFPLTAPVMVTRNMKWDDELWSVDDFKQFIAFWIRPVSVQEVHSDNCWTVRVRHLDAEVMFYYSTSFTVDVGCGPFHIQKLNDSD